MYASLTHMNKLDKNLRTGEIGSAWHVQIFIKYLSQYFFLYYLSESGLLVCEYRELGEF